MKKNVLFNMALLCIGSLSAQTVSVPDANLMQKFTTVTCASYAENPEVFGNYVDANGDGQIQTSEALNVTGLDISTSAFNTSGDIVSLEGLQYFTNLKKLYVTGNQIANLDLTPFVNLQVLKCDHNNLAALEISNLAQLNFVNCSFNSMTNLELNNLPQLKTLYSVVNELSTLSLNLPALESLQLDSNQLTQLSLENLPALKDFQASHNQFATVVLQPAASTLEYVNMSFNPLTSLDLSAMATLRTLLVTNTSIETIDCSETAINKLVCFDSPNLTYINVQNNLLSSGDGDMLDFPFEFANLPSLEGVCIDAGEFSWLSSSTVNDPDVTIYSGADCSLGIDNVRDQSVSIWPNPASDRLNIRSGNAVSGFTIVNTLGQAVLSGEVVATEDLTIEVSGLETGVYLVKLETNAGTSIHRIIRK